MSLQIFCADIGSITNDNFAWARAEAEPDRAPKSSNRNIDALVKELVAALRLDYDVALGFECPLYIPMRQKAHELTCARPGEGNRSWSAGAGCATLASGLAQSLYVLNKIRDKLDPDSLPTPFVDPSAFSIYDARPKILFWEAFVTGPGRGDHLDDARRAADLFSQTWENLETTDKPSFSLIGAALLRARWSEDLSFLGQPCLMIRTDRSPEVAEP